MYNKYRIVECITSSVSQYESYRGQVYRYTPTHWRKTLPENYYCYLPWQVNLMGALTCGVSFLISFFLRLIVACRLCVIYVKEDNDSNV